MENNGYFNCPTCGKILCPTCGSEREPQFQPSFQPQFKSGRIVNQLVRPMPQEAPKPPAPDSIQSEQVTEDGKPLVKAQWNEQVGKMPNTPIGR